MFPAPVETCITSKLYRLGEGGGAGTGVGGTRRLLSLNSQWLRLASATFSCRVPGKVPIWGLIRKWVWLSFSWEEAKKRSHNLYFNSEMALPYSPEGKRRWLGDGMLKFDLERSVWIGLPVQLFFFCRIPLSKWQGTISKGCFIRVAPEMFQDYSPMTYGWADVSKTCLLVWHPR